MPRFRKKRGRMHHKKKKRAIRVNWQNRLNATVLPSPYTDGTLLKKTLKVKMRYVNRITIDPAAGGMGVQVFAANGMFDPDITGGGHQPRGFDNLMPLYNHYTVIGSKLTVSSANIATQASGALLGVSLQDTTLVLGNVNDYLEDYSSTNIFGIASAESHITLSMDFSNKKFLGPNPLADDRKGTVTSNPVESAFYHIYFAPVDVGIDLSIRSFLVVIDYIALLTEPNQPGQS